jgi:hypothetical protein
VQWSRGPEADSKRLWTSRKEGKFRRKENLQSSVVVVVLNVDEMDERQAILKVRCREQGTRIKVFAVQQWNPTDHEETTHIPCASFPLLQVLSAERKRIQRQKTESIKENLLMAISKSITPNVPPLLIHPGCHYAAGDQNQSQIRGPRC